MTVPPLIKISQVYSNLDEGTRGPAKWLCNLTTTTWVPWSDKKKMWVLSPYTQNWPWWENRPLWSASQMGNSESGNKIPLPTKERLEAKMQGEGGLKGHSVEVGHEMRSGFEQNGAIPGPMDATPGRSFLNKEGYLLFPLHEQPLSHSPAAVDGSSLSTTYTFILFLLFLRLCLYHWHEVISHYCFDLISPIISSWRAFSHIPIGYLFLLWYFGGHMQLWLRLFSWITPWSTKDNNLQSGTDDRNKAGY